MFYVVWTYVIWMESGLNTSIMLLCYLQCQSLCCHSQMALWESDVNFRISTEVIGHPVLFAYCFMNAMHLDILLISHKGYCFLPTIYSREVSQCTTSTIILVVFNINIKYCIFIHTLSQQCTNSNYLSSTLKNAWLQAQHFGHFMELRDLHNYFRESG